ncbi:hypothetical protein E2C01_033925 [Portunus trituberculatus]|uniref:Uncharacterized protein n=1 Tax=Portunus trituberculatus TaxID=210409 RepID=A0A5B7F510_PORTR|nr:hypothetical protein [Portunus trituberculatus]
MDYLYTRLWPIPRYMQVMRGMPGKPLSPNSPLSPISPLEPGRPGTPSTPLSPGMPTLASTETTLAFVSSDSYQASKPWLPSRTLVTSGSWQARVAS